MTSEHALRSGEEASGYGPDSGLAIRLRRLWGVDRPVLIAVAVFVAVAAVYASIQEGVLTVDELNIQVAAALPLVFVACGQTIVMLAGGIDLSVGAIAGLTTCLLATRLPSQGVGIVVWIALIIVIGLVVGALNGVIIAYLRMAPFIVTLAVWSILDGVALLVLPTPGGEIPESLMTTLTGTVGTIGVSTLVLIALIVIWAWARGTRTVSRLRAVGSSRSSAHLAGTPVRRYQVLAYTISGGLAAIGGLFLAVQLGAGEPTAGTSFVLDSVAAAVIGGASLAGGRGDFFGGIAGALTLTIVGSVVFALGLPTYWQTISIGLLLVLVALTGALSQRRGKVGAE